MTMIEKVARALCVADGYTPEECDTEVGHAPAPLWHDYINRARAAIAAMEPTEAMLERACRAEAHAERLASIIARGLAMEQAPPYANDMGARRAVLRKDARQALSAYKQGKETK